MKKSLRLFGALVFALGLLTVPARAAARHAAITVVDDHGATITLSAPPRRIISLAPNVTEILFSLGLGPRVVGVSSYSDYPAAAKRLPVVISYTSANIEKIVALKPDLLIAAGIVPQPIVAKLRSLRLPVLVTDPSTIPGILKDISMVGTATGATAAATAEVSSLRRRIGRVESLVRHTKERPRVFYELDKTLYTAGRGSFVDSLITMAGGVDIADKIDNPYPQLSPETLIADNPQYIILGDYYEGTSIASVAARPGYASISAVRDHHIYGFNDDLASRPGPRIVDGLEKMAQLLHPGLVLH